MKAVAALLLTILSAQCASEESCDARGEAYASLIETVETNTLTTCQHNGAAELRCGEFFVDVEDETTARVYYNANRSTAALWGSVRCEIACDPHCVVWRGGYAH